MRQRQTHLIPLLCKQLNELDSTFQLPEGPYTFEYERQARDILEVAYAEYIASSATQDQSQAIISLSGATPPSVTNDAAQVGPGIGGAGRGMGDAVIDIPLPIDSGKADDDSEVVVDNEQIP
jgi:hypothetical protein